MTSRYLRRRLGLSVQDVPEPLLKSLPRNRTRSRQDAKPQTKDQKNEPKKMENEDIYGPPIDFDDQSDSDVALLEDDGRNPPVLDFLSLKSDDKPGSSDAKNDKKDETEAVLDPIESSDDEDSQARGDIKVTSFGKSKKEERDPSWLRQNSYGGRSAPQRKTYVKKRGLALAKEGGITSKAKTIGSRKRPLGDSPKREKKKVKKHSEELKKEASPVRLKLPEDFDESPEKERSVRSSGLVVPPDDSPETGRKAPTLRLKSISPEKPATRPVLNTRILESVSPGKPGRRSARLRDFTLSPVLPSRALGSPSQPVRNADALPSTQFLLGELSSELSDLDDLSQEKEVEPTHCPYCNEIVDRDLLEKFSQGSRMTIRVQRQFCTEHKKQEARDAWKSRAYPVIDWAGLHSRIMKHHDYLEKVLNGARSHYGDMLAKDVKSGKKRNLMKAEFHGSTGYYGARGFRAMQEDIFERFPALLRERAVQDELVAARGYSIYVQAVLVPELATRLVMDDMKVEAEEARRILGESAWVGDLLCDDAGDVVNESDDDVF